MHYMPTFSHQTQGGRSVKLKCSSVKEAEDWKEALEAESAVPVDIGVVVEESSATEVFLFSLCYVQDINSPH